jgi:hypothetical protein
MKKVVIPVAILLGLLLLASTSLAVGPDKLWWTEFTSEVFAWSGEVPCTYLFEGSNGTVLWYIMEGAADAPAYRGTLLLRPRRIQVRTDEPGLHCVDDIDPPRIRPGQAVRFHIGWLTVEAMSHQDAEDLFDSLSFTVSSDCEPRMVVLERQGTHRHYEGIDWTKAFCPWTVRP